MKRSKVHIGTSGYQYDDWVGPVYPPDLPKRDWLTWYARRFPAVELNFSYYRMPNARGLEAIAAKAGDGLRFAIKMHGSVTHERTEAPEGAVREFRRALLPLVERAQLGPVLLQFPYAFRRTPENRSYLARVLDALEGLPVAVEVRRSEWLDARFREGLKERSVALVAVDLPRLDELPEPEVEVTAPFAYVRFHGRNAEQWWRHEKPADRYDHRYSEAELRPWVPRLVQMAKESGELYVFTNNHFLGKAVEAADLLEGLLRHAGLLDTSSDRSGRTRPPEPEQGALPF